MSKTIEEIMHSVGYTQDGTKSNFSFNEVKLVAERYAQYKTQGLIEQNRELVSFIEDIKIQMDYADDKYLNEIGKQAKELLTKYNHLNQKP